MQIGNYEMNSKGLRLCDTAKLGLIASTGLATLPYLLQIALGVEAGAQPSGPQQ